MLGHRASGRSAAAEVLSRSLNLGPVYLSDRIFMFEVRCGVWGGAEEMP